MIKEPTCDVIDSPSPSVVVFVALNPTQVTRSIPANTNREQKTKYNINISTYLTQIKSIRYEMHILFKNTLHKKWRHIYEKINNNLY